MLLTSGSISDLRCVCGFIFIVIKFEINFFSSFAINKHYNNNNTRPHSKGHINWAFETSPKNKKIKKNRKYKNMSCHLAYGSWLILASPPNGRRLSRLKWNVAQLVQSKKKKGKKKEKTYSIEPRKRPRGTAAATTASWLQAERSSWYLLSIIQK